MIFGNSEVVIVAQPLAKAMPDPDPLPSKSPKPRGKVRGYVQRISRIPFAIFEWIGLHEVSVLLATLMLILAVWGFAFLAWKVEKRATESFDEWAILVLRRPNDLKKPIGPPWLPEVGRDFTALGGVAVLTCLTLSVAGFLWLRKMYGAMFLVLAATLGGLFVSTLLKSMFDRARPDFVPHLSDVYTSSFPSGHSMLSAVVYLTLGTLLGRFVTQRSLQAYFLITALLLTGSVGLSRVYMGVHYPTDVLAGWIAGLAWAIVCWIVARKLQRRGVVEQGRADVSAAPAHTETSA